MLFVAKAEAIHGSLRVARSEGCGWELALAEAHAEMEINFEANSMLNAETGAWTSADVLAQAKQLRMPCWFFHGAADPRPVSTVANLAKAIPQSQLHVIQGAGHTPWRERPDDLCRLLHHIVATTDDGGGASMRH